MQSVSIKIKDVVVRPLDLNTSKGVISNKNSIVSFLKNESGQSDTYIQDVIENKLIPYNCNTHIKMI